VNFAQNLPVDYNEGVTLIGSTSQDDTTIKVKLLLYLHIITVSLFLPRLKVDIHLNNFCKITFEMSLPSARLISVRFYEL
jgi:hypothetical protein